MKSGGELDPISFRTLEAKVSLLEFSVLPVFCQIPLLVASA